MGGDGVSRKRPHQQISWDSDEAGPSTRVSPAVAQLRAAAPEVVQRPAQEMPPMQAQAQARPPHALADLAHLQGLRQGMVETAPMPPADEVASIGAASTEAVCSPGQQQHPADALFRMFLPLLPPAMMSSADAILAKMQEFNLAEFHHTEVFLNQLQPPGDIEAIISRFKLRFHELLDGTKTCTNARSVEIHARLLIEVARRLPGEVEKVARFAKIALPLMLEGGVPLCLNVRNFPAVNAVTEIPALPCQRRQGRMYTWGENYFIAVRPLRPLDSHFKQALGLANLDAAGRNVACTRVMEMLGFTGVLPAYEVGLVEEPGNPADDQPRQAALSLVSYWRNGYPSSETLAAAYFSAPVLHQFNGLQLVDALTGQPGRSGADIFMDVWLDGMGDDDDTITNNDAAGGRIMGAFVFGTYSDYSFGNKIKDPNDIPNLRLAVARYDSKFRTEIRDPHHLPSRKLPRSQYPGVSLFPDAVSLPPMIDEPTALALEGATEADLKQCLDHILHPSEIKAAVVRLKKIQSHISELRQKGLIISSIPGWDEIVRQVQSGIPTPFTPENSYWMREAAAAKYDDMLNSGQWQVDPNLDNAANSRAKAKWDTDRQTPAFVLRATRSIRRTPTDLLSLQPYLDAALGAYADTSSDASSDASSVPGNPFLMGSDASGSYESGSDSE